MTDLENPTSQSVEGDKTPEIVELEKSIEYSQKEEGKFIPFVLGKLDKEQEIRFYSNLTTIQSGLKTALIENNRDPTQKIAENVYTQLDQDLRREVNRKPGISERKFEDTKITGTLDEASSLTKELFGLNDEELGKKGTEIIEKYKKLQDQVSTRVERDQTIRNGVVRKLTEGSDEIRRQKNKIYGVMEQEHNPFYNKLETSAISLLALKTRRVSELTESDLLLKSGENTALGQVKSFSIDTVTKIQDYIEKRGGKTLQ